MTDPIDEPNDDYLDDPEFQQLLVDCLQRLEQGEELSREELLGRHPQYADVLGRFLDNHALLQKVASGIRDSHNSDPASGSTDETIDTSPMQRKPGRVERIQYIGEYEVLEEIARGGMGVVFKARQQTLQRIVALKMILAGRLADEAEVDRFYREAQAAGRLKHSNIVPVHEIGEHEGHHYFTMDFIDGHSLSVEIRDESLEPRRAAKLMKTVAEAIQFAHDAGTLHRDLKPANILLTADDVPHVTDFGLAKILDERAGDSRTEITATGQILGTPSYMSPEQAAGKPNLVGTASDIYSLGAVLYASLTGRAPFVADSPADTLLQVLRQDPVAPRQLNPSVPRDLETICLKCLHKEPHRRYGTAHELADDLERFLAGRPVQARPISRTAKAWRWMKRNPAVAASLALVAISLVAGTGVSSYFAVEASERAKAEKEAKERQADLLQETKDLAADLTDSLARETGLKGEALTAKGLAEQQLMISQRALYALQLARSQDQWASAPFESLQGLQNETRCPPELRDFSWRYLSNLTDRFVRELPGHQVPSRIDITPDGKLIASCSMSQNIKVISTDTWESWPMEVKPEKWVRKVAFLPDNRTLVSGGMDQSVTVWNALTGKKLRTVEHGENVEGLSASPDGKWVAAGGKEQTRLWRTSDWEEAKIFAHGAQEIEFTNDSQTMIVGSGSKIIFQKLDANESETWEGQSMIRGLAVSPDGKLLLSSDMEVVLLRELVTGQVLHRVTEPLKAEFDDVRFSPDGKTFATTAGVYPIRIWDVETGRLIGDIGRYFGSTHTIAFLPDGEHIVTPAEHHIANLKLWKVPRKDPARKLDQRALWMAASRDTNRLASTNQNSIKIWDFGTGEVIRSLTLETTAPVEAPIGRMVFLPGGRQLLAVHGDYAVGLWDVETGELLRKFENLDRGKGVAFDPVHRRIALPGKGQVVSVRDFDTGEEIKTLDRYKQDLHCLAFSPDGQWLAFGDGWDPLPDGTPPGRLNLCHVESGEIIPLKGHKQFGIYDLTFSPDGRTLVSVGGDGIIWDVPSGKQLARLEGHQSSIFSVDISPDGKTIATASMDKTIRLWDSITGELRLTLEGHPYWATSAEFNHDSTRLVSCSYDGQMRFWHAPIPAE